MEWNFMFNSSPDHRDVTVAAKRDGQRLYSGVKEQQTDSRGPNLTHH